jgi:hypothetical protein
MIFVLLFLCFVNLFVPRARVVAVFCIGTCGSLGEVMIILRCITGPTESILCFVVHIISLASLIASITHVTIAAVVYWRSRGHWWR